MTLPLDAEQLRVLEATKQPGGSATPPLKHGVVGLSDGAAVGVAVGSSVGLAVGSDVGLTVGSEDGDAVGVNVGALVGASEQLLQNTRQLAATVGDKHATSGPSTLSQPGGSDGSSPSASWS